MSLYYIFICHLTCQSVGFLFCFFLKKMLPTESSLVLVAWKKAISFKHHWTCRIALHWRGECLQKVIICHTIWGAWLQVLLSQHSVKRMENWLLTCHAWYVYCTLLTFVPNLCNLCPMKSYHFDIGVLETNSSWLWFLNYTSWSQKLIWLIDSKYYGCF